MRAQLSAAVLQGCCVGNDLFAALSLTTSYTKNANDTVAAGMKGGCDLDCGAFYTLNAYNAYLSRTISRDDLELAMTRLFTARCGEPILLFANQITYSHS